MNEHELQRAPEARVAGDRTIPDFRRLEVTTRRFAQYIVDGIATAQAERHEISTETARCIAHVLGRAYGRESALADFGRNGEGQYLTLRDEYLDLYGDPTLQPKSRSGSTGSAHTSCSARTPAAAANS